MNIPFCGQSLQDKFVVNVSGQKHGGTFLEIGSNDPILINNTYILEKAYNWTGIMLEYSDQWLEQYRQHRPQSIHIIKDARQIDYDQLLSENNMPSDIDYLQVDIEVSNGSTLEALKKLDNEAMDRYRFAIITFEHDRYIGPHVDETRRQSREIFKRRGYHMVFSDISNCGNAYEDWYVHPDLVDMEYVTALKGRNLDKYVVNPITGTSLPFETIEYD